MSNDINQSLSEIYELIEANDLNEAERLLKPILSEHPDNADAWWLYAHAVQDPEAARMALNTVLKLDEDYPEAKQLLQSLDEKYPEAVFIPPSLPDLPATPSSNDNDFDLDFDEDEFDDDDEELEEEAEADGRSGLILMVLALLAIAVVVIGVLLNPLGTGSDDDSTPTSVAFALTEDGSEENGAIDENALTATAIAQGSDQPADEVGLTSTAIVAEGTAAAAEQGIGFMTPDETAQDQDDVQLTSTAIIEQSTAIAAEQGIGQSDTDGIDTNLTTEASLTQSAAGQGGDEDHATPIGSSQASPTESASLGVLPAVTGEDPNEEVDTSGVVGGLPTDPEAQTGESDGEIITEETTETNLTAVLNALDEFTLHDEGVGVADTELGKTLLASVCSDASLQSRVEVSNAAMRAMANAGTLIDEDIDATGIKLIHCETERTLHVIGVDVNTSIDFSSGTIDIKQYEAAWRPVL
jgi:hypothetical protein